MRIFNEENMNDEIILILQAKEVKMIIEAFVVACENRPRKTTWKKMFNELDEKAPIY